MHPKDADGMANNVEPDQTAPSCLIWVSLFAQAYLSENLKPVSKAYFMVKRVITPQPL